MVTGRVCVACGIQIVYPGKKDSQETKHVRTGHNDHNLRIHVWQHCDGLL